MINKKENAGKNLLADTENQLLYRLDECIKQSAEPQLTEDLRKIYADVSNCRRELLKSAEGQSNE